jgi:hypothetical protein
MSQPGYVYIVYGQGTNYIKIGKTTNVVKRLRELQHGVPFPLQLISVQLVHDMDVEEQRLLKKYHAYHTRGEWCVVPNDVLRQWPIETAMAPVIPGVFPVEASTKKSMPSHIVEAMRGVESITGNELCELLAITSKAKRSLMRVCLFRLVEKGVVERLSRNSYRIFAPPISSNEAYDA